MQFFGLHIHSFGKQTHTKKLKNKQASSRIEIPLKLYLHLPGVPNITRWFSS